MLLRKLRSIRNEFPRAYWVLVLASYIDVIGRSAVKIFFALYVTQRFGVGMAQAGALLGLFGISGMVGRTVGGALTDHFGRRSVMVFGLISSALTTLSFAFIPSMDLFYPAVLIAGFFSSIGGPAQQAMVADLLPEEKRTQGFGVWRVASNLGWLTGPILGGFLASYSIATIFALDAFLSVGACVLIYLAIPETHPASKEQRATGTRGIASSFVGYREVLGDLPYLAFLLPCVLLSLAYQQCYSTLTVYLRDVHAVSSQPVGTLFSCDALFVIFLQFWFIRLIQKRAPFLMMAAGAAFTALGLAMYGVVLGYPLFVVAHLVIAAGEMIWLPTGQSLASRFAPAAMRGRYMALFGLTFGFASAMSSWLGGLVLDSFDPRWVWYLSGLIAAGAGLGFVALHRRNRRKPLIAAAKEA